jgi:hypothetical protein
MSTNMTEINEGFIQYPVPGIDNDSQGFRDRYSIIRANLNIAREEINGLLADTAKVNTNNNFNGNKIIDANLNSSTVEANTSKDGDPITDNLITISYASGNVHVIRVGNGGDNGSGGQLPLSIDFSNWPEATSNSDNRFAKITLFVNAGLTGTRQLVWPAGIKKQQITPDLDIQSVISAGTTVKIFEIFTYDSGNTLFISYQGVYE